MSRAQNPPRHGEGDRAQRGGGGSPPAPATRIWQGIEAEDPPCLRHDYPELLAMAERMAASREKRFPAMVAAGELDADLAAHQLELFRQIAADWRWICTGEGKRAPHATFWDRREALDESLRTVAGIARQQHGFDDALANRAHCLIALRWHYEPETFVRTLAAARLTHALRAQVAEGGSPTRDHAQAKDPPPPAGEGDRAQRGGGGASPVSTPKETAHV